MHSAQPSPSPVGKIKGLAVYPQHHPIIRDAEPGSHHRLEIQDHWSHSSSGERDVNGLNVRVVEVTDNERSVHGCLGHERNVSRPETNSSLSFVSSEDSVRVDDEVRMSNGCSRTGEASTENNEGAVARLDVTPTARIPGRRRNRTHGPKSRWSS